MGRMRTKTAIALLGLCSFLLILGAGASAPSSTLASPRKALWLAGFERALAGNTIRYHSSHPQANSALIVRATAEEPYIEWLTAPVPDTRGTGFINFVWLAGLATGKGAHAFELSIDGRTTLTFTTPADAAAKQQEFFGPDGSSLVFQAAMTDQFQELFGPMILSVPASACRPGRPLTLGIKGSNAGSPDWVMVFQHRLRDRIDIQAEQALLRQGRSLVQLVRVDIERLGSPVEAEVSVPGASTLKAAVETGYNSFYLPLKAVDSPRDISLGIRLDRKPAANFPLNLRPVVRRTLYLLPHSHNDIGYSDLQTKVEKDQWRFLEEGIALAKKTAGYPAEARFKWNVEILWPVESYLAQADEAKRREFADAVKNGWVGLEAPLANNLTGLCGGEELLHLTDFSRRLVRRYGLPPIVSGMMSDIPGSTWSLVPALALAGVKYFSSGPNYVPFLPDGGDRIGFTSKAWGDKPFYWVSPSGEHKVLFWMAGRGYSWFHGLNQGNLGRSGEKPILDYVRELQDQGYPYEIVQVRYTVGGDNGPPDPLLPDRVKAWNEKYESPRLVIATSAQLFQEFERRYGASLPSVAGDMTPYWEDGAMSSARETVMNQRAKDRLLQAEALWAMIDPAGYPAEDFYQAWRRAVLYDEHTWGASNSISQPDAPEVKMQWDYKSALAVEADKASRELLDKALQSAERKAAPAGWKPGQEVTVFNTCSWPRTDLVLIPAASSQAGDRVTDEEGRPIPSQRLSTGDLAVLAKDVPGLGSKRLRLGPGAAFAEGRVEAAGNVLSGDTLRLTVDRATGAISSLVWTNRGLELVDGGRNMGLNDYFYVAGRDPRFARRSEQPRITVKERGPLLASLLVESRAPGCKALSRELRVVRGLDRLEIVNTLDKSKVRDKESAHFAFPFRLPDGMVRLDVGWGIVRGGADQLAGACMDYLSAQNWVDVSGNDYGLTLATPDAPLIEPGTITDETKKAGGTRSWKNEWPGGTTLFSYAINNYWHTNYKADQEGPLAFRYALRPHGTFDAAEAKRFGLEVGQPLVVAAFASPLETTKPLLEVVPSSVLAASVKPSEDGRALMVRLYAAAGRPETVEVRVPGFESSAVYRSGLGEERGPRLTGPFELPAFGIITLRIEK